MNKEKINHIFMKYILSLYLLFMSQVMSNFINIFYSLLYRYIYEKGVNIKFDIEI